MADRLFIIRLAGDFYTKSRGTRLQFQRRLASNVRDALRASGIPHRLERTWSRFYLETEDAGASEVLTRVFGVQSVSEVERRPWSTLDDVVRAGVEVFAGKVQGRSFAVRASRRSKNGQREVFGFDSQAVEIALGRALLDAGAGRVDLGAPEVTAYVELEPGGAHLFEDKARGHGGLPIGVEGRALALVSGGFDSAVASWILLKRGVQLDYLFCNLGGTAHRLGVLKVLEVLATRWSYGSRPRLHEVDFQPLAAEIQAGTNPRNWQILLKRQMVRAGEIIGRRTGRLALITGDAIGQVSSQTLQNLAVVSQAASALPILRPLLGFNKEEILALARQIGIYELSAAVGEYCALVPRKPATRAPLKETLAEESVLDLGRLDELIAARQTYELRRLAPELLAPPELEIGHVPEGATVLDLRPKSAWQAWHYPDSLRLDFPQALQTFGSFDRERTYVLVCEVGLKSAHLAEEMRKGGFRAYHFAGGAGELMELEARKRRLSGLERALLAPAVRD
ncbi:MAG TPA: THUMP domain-containing protein [Thermoanaerobaculia bacterium]|nr:THUMP domain-containing protein [Thermoanaerobaculia bacterium]